MAMRLRRPDESGQMTVELAAVFPVVIVVAVIALNALTFFSECAAFDNAFREAVRVNAASPAYGQGLSDSVSLAEAALAAAFDDENLAVSVAFESVSGGYSRFSGTLTFLPTLFGLGLVDSVFGVEMPKLTHTVQFTVDVYKAGVLI